MFSKTDCNKHQHHLVAAYTAAFPRPPKHRKHQVCPGSGVMSRGKARSSEWCIQHHTASARCSENALGSNSRDPPMSEISRKLPQTCMRSPQPCLANSLCRVNSDGLPMPSHITDSDMISIRRMGSPSAYCSTFRTLQCPLPA